MKHFVAISCISTLAACVAAPAYAADTEKPLAATVVSTNECTSGWQYVFNPPSQFLTLQVQPKPGMSFISLNIDSAATAPRISGSRTGPTWSLDVAVPPSYANALTTAFNKKQMLYVSVSFTQTPGSSVLNLVNFAFTDTNAPC